MVIFMRGLRTVIELADHQSNSNKPLKISKGGNLVIGQEQNSFKGGFKKDNSYTGLLADLFLSAEVLDFNFINAYLLCDVFYPEVSIINFTNIIDTFDVYEDTEILELESSEICEKDEMNLVFLDENAKFHIAEEFCSSLNGTIPVPLDKRQNEYFYRNSDRCRKLGFIKAWIGIKGNNSTGNIEPYHHFTKENLNFSTWKVPLIPLDNINCGIALLGTELSEFNVDGWSFDFCDSSLCTSCSFTDQTILRARGICEDSNFDRNFIVHGYFNDKMFFSGEYLSTIRWSIIKDNTDNQKGFWLLEVNGRNNTFAKMDMVSEFDYPIGVHTWKAIGSNCKTDENGRIELLFTACDHDMFTCGDGSCVPMEKRCDLKIDCKDESDELQCFIVKKPKGYDSTKPPPRIDPNIPIMVEATLFIYSFHKIDLVNDHVTVEIMFKRKWFDSKVILKNLKKNKSHNMFDFEAFDIWHPNIKIMGEDNCTGEVQLLDKKSWAERNSNPIKDDGQNVLKGNFSYLVSFRYKPCHIDFKFYINQSTNFILRKL